MFKNKSAHTLAIFQGLFVTVLWSSSWVLIKIGLVGIPPITFAGLRYVLGFLILLPFVANKNISHIKALNKRQWLELIALGIFMYFLTQGAQFLSIKHFPSVLVVLVWAFTPVVVGTLSNIFLKEKATPIQAIGVVVSILGIALYLIPRLQQGLEMSWLLMIPVIGVMTNSVAGLLGRAINRREHLPPSVITIVSMGIGSFFLLGTGIVVEPFPVLDLKQWMIIVWLAGINTAFAFTIWNKTLRYLSTVESSVINNTMMIQIAALTWIFLGEALTTFEIVALFITAIGTLLVQLKNVKLFSR